METVFDRTGTPCARGLRVDCCARRSAGAGRAVSVWRRRLGRDRSAAAALEFAIASVPFLALLLFFFEMGLDYYYQTALDYGVAKSARQVQIGNAAKLGVTTPAQFKAKLLCPALAGLLNCDAINVASVTIAGAPDYYQATLPSPTQGGTLSMNSYSAGFTVGTQNAPMYLQAVLQSPSLIAGLIPGFSTPTGSGQVRLTVSSAAFINENYSNAPATPPVPPAPPG